MTLAPKVSEIQAAVAREHKIDPASMVWPDGRGARNRVFSWPRQEAIFLSTLLTEHSFNRIGQFFGRDHSTVMSACQSVMRRRAADPKLHKRLRRIALELVLQ